VSLIRNKDRMPTGYSKDENSDSFGLYNPRVAFNPISMSP
jgi:hypothetical protein